MSSACLNPIHFLHFLGFWFLSALCARWPSRPSKHTLFTVPAKLWRAQQPSRLSEERRDYRLARSGSRSDPAAVPSEPKMKHSLHRQVATVRPLSVADPPPSPRAPRSAIARPVSVLDSRGFVFAAAPAGAAVLPRRSCPWYGTPRENQQSGVLGVIYLFLTSVNLLLPLLLAVLFSYLTCTFSGFPYKSEAARLRMRRVREGEGGDTDGDRGLGKGGMGRGREGQRGC